MTDPITPPTELVAQWLKQFYGLATRLGTLAPGEASLHVAAEAAQWAADQELEACEEWVEANFGQLPAHNLHQFRRPKPPTDKELLRTYGKAKRDHCYEGDLDDWPKKAERAATVAGLRAVLERWGHG